MNTFIQDFRYALRQLRHSPGFTLTVILTLALGIGSTAAVFTVFDRALLRMLPVSHPQELVRFHWTGGFQGTSSSFGGDQHDYFSYPMYRDLRQQNQAFSDILAADKANVGVSWRNSAANEDAEIVSGNYFEMLGLRPAVGRLFNERDETAKDANPVAVLSYDYWKIRFAGDRNVIGQTALVNGHPFTIVGVAPSHFDSAIGDFRPGIFVPITMVDEASPWRNVLDDLHNHQSIWLTLVARRKPGISDAQAEASLGPVWHSLRASELTLYKSHTARFDHNFVDASQLKVIGNARGFAPSRMTLRKPLFILMGMSVMLIALCAINVATLLVLRATARAREISMRYALGAQRARIVMQLLVEGGLLGLLGAGAGVLLAHPVALFLVRLMTASDPGEEPYSAAIDLRVLLFTLGISLLVTLLFSAAPLFYFLRPDMVNSLRQNSGTASRGSQRFRKIAVGVEVGLSVLLLGSAGLFVHTLANLRATNVGFATDHLMTFSLDPSTSGYDEAHTAAIVRNGIDAISSIPGVAGAGATNDPLLSDSTNTSGFSIQGYKPGEEESMNFESGSVTPGYFAALRQPVLAGREFTASDALGRPRVAVVDLTFAKRFFGSPQNAIGRILSNDNPSNHNDDMAIVGVVGNIRHRDLRTPMTGAVYLSYLQNEHPTGVQIYVRTAGDPASVMTGIRGAIHQLDPLLIVDGLRTMDAQIDRISSDERALAYLALGFAVLAVLLAGVGLYGVLAYSTGQRTREIGIRLALGASRTSVVSLVVREMAWIVAAATVLALPVTVALAQLFRGQLYGVKIFDLSSLSIALGVVAAMVLMAAILPARRAAAVEPMQALRSE
jgi:putative ABC transport system permease protein